MLPRESKRDTKRLLIRSALTGEPAEGPLNPFLCVSPYRERTHAPWRAAACQPKKREGPATHAGPSLQNRLQELVLHVAHVTEIAAPFAGSQSDQEVAIHRQLVVHVVA